MSVTVLRNALPLEHWFNPSIAHQSITAVQSMFLRPSSGVCNQYATNQGREQVKWVTRSDVLQGVRSALRYFLRSRRVTIGRPKALDAVKTALAQRMHASGESASTIARTLAVSRATVYRVLAEQGPDSLRRWWHPLSIAR
jgi:hypothetical protein